MVYAFAPGEHAISLIQYEDNDEEGRVLNKVSKKYIIILDE